MVVFQIENKKREGKSLIVVCASLRQNFNQARNPKKKKAIIGLGGRGKTGER